MSSDKVVIFIVGPHRSGTSAIAGEVARLTGADFGKLLMQAQHDNRQGFYENEQIVDLNDDLLAHLHRTLEDPRPVDKSAFVDSGLDHLRKRGVEIIHREFGASALISMKDPRLCQTLPFWIDICQSLGYKPKIILTYRTVDDIISSIRSRDVITEEHAYLLTSSFLLSAERHSRGVDRVQVSYDRCLEDPPYLAAMLQEGLGLSTVDTKGPSHITPRLHHHKDKQNEADISKPRLEARTEISEALNHLEKSTVLKDHHLDTSRLDAAYKAITSITYERGPDILTARVDYGKVLYIYESDTITYSTYPLGRGRTQITCVWQKDDRPDSIIIIPVHRPTTLKDLKIAIDPEMGFELGHNSTWENGKSIGFADTQPRIKIDFTAKSVGPGSCNVSYLTTDYKSQHTDRPLSTFSLGFKAVTLALSRPMRALSLLNTQNWRTLQSAIKRESPKRIVRNLIRLIQRDKKTIERQTSVPSTMPISRLNHIYQKRILHVTNDVPAFDQSSGDRRADKLLQLLSKDADVICKARSVIDDSYVSRLQEMGIGVIIDSTESWKKDIGKIDVIIYDMYYTFHDESHLRKYFPHARHIVDSVDVHWVREERGLSFDNEMSAKRVAANKKNELSAYQEAQEVWVVSDADKSALIKEGISEEKVAWISNIHEINVEEYVPSQEKILFFLGNYNHLPNVWSARHIAKDIYPEIQKHHPASSLWIAGSNAPDEVRRLGDREGVKFLGYIPEEQLSAIYSQVSLVLAPVVSGAGVKGKILEAIAYAKPVLTNDMGNEGIDIKHTQDGFVANSIASTVQYSTEILNGAYDLKNIARNAQANVLSRFSEKEARLQLRKRLYAQITICIVTHNRLDLLRSCIESILSHTVYPTY